MADTAGHMRMVRPRAGSDLPPGLAFLSENLPLEALLTAAAEAKKLGIAPEAALISRGTISEEAYYAALAQAAGVSFLAPGWRRFDKGFLARALLKGQVPQDVVLLEPETDGLTHALAPRGWQVKNLLDQKDRDPAVRARVTVVPPSALRDELRIVLREAGHARAAEYLKRFEPNLSAATRVTRPQAASLGLLFVAVLAIAAARPEWVAIGASSLLSLVFASHIGLKMTSLFNPPAPVKRGPLLPDHALPEYAALVPLYQEKKEVIGQLREALLALDYPSEN